MDLEGLCFPNDLSEYGLEGDMLYLLCFLSPTSSSLEANCPKRPNLAGSRLVSFRVAQVLVGCDPTNLKMEGSSMERVLANLIGCRSSTVGVFGFRV
jgi:hypothetical protein